MNIVYKTPDELTPYENNPRNNDDAVAAVASSIRQFGWKVPLVIDKDGVIITGHTRYKAALELGIDRIPCVIADDLTDEQARAFRLADNKTSEFSRWIPELLTQEIAGIDIDMEELGVRDETVPSFDDFFVEAEEKEKKPKTYTCPCCGKEFEA